MSESVSIEEDYRDQVDWTVTSMGQFLTMNKISPPAAFCALVNMAMNMAAHHCMQSDEEIIKDVRSCLIKARASVAAQKKAMH